MGIKERRERERDVVRTRILDAARELFATQGYKGVSMRGIAEKIEYSPTAIYQHFKDKEALIKELCYSDFGKLAEQLQIALQNPHPIERLALCGAEYVKFAIANPNHYRLMFMTPYPVTGSLEEQAEMKGKPEFDAYTLVRGLVQTAAAEGALRDPAADLDLVAQTLWAGLHGVIALHIALACHNWSDWRPIEDRAAAMLGALGSGLFAEKK
jgi:AcrR family transcriptional regulator